MKHLIILIAALIYLTSCGENDTEATSNTKEEKVNTQDAIEIDSISDETTDSISEEVKEEIPYADYPYEGEIDGEKIYMKLQFDINTISGQYITETMEEVKKLDGTYTYDGFVLNEKNSSGKVLGHFIASGDFLNFVGFWVTSEQIKEAPVSIRQGHFDRRFKGTADQVNLAKTDYDWYYIVPGLDPSCEECVSFQLLTNPKLYLRHQNYILKLHEKDSSSLFNQDASFKMQPGLNDDSKASFQSLNFPDLYVRFMGTKAELKHTRYVSNAASTFSLIYDYTQIEDQQTKFKIGARYHSYGAMPEGVDLLHGRLQPASGVFVSYELGGDMPHIAFRKDGGDIISFEGNADESIELYRELTHDEMQMTKHEYSQGYTSNEQYVGKVFTMYWAETYKHVENFDSPFGKARVIYRIKAR